jgi:hypothetical protein
MASAMARRRLKKLEELYQPKYDANVADAVLHPEWKFRYPPGLERYIHEMGRGNVFIPSRARDAGRWDGDYITRAEHEAKLAADRVDGGVVAGPDASGAVSTLGGGTGSEVTPDSIAADQPVGTAPLRIGEYVRCPDGKVRQIEGEDEFGPFVCIREAGVPGAERRRVW